MSFSVIGRSLKALGFSRVSPRNPLSAICLVVVLSGISVLGTGCGASFCAGSGCDDGQIVFGSNYSQKNANSDISIVHKASTFTLGHPFAMVAHLKENAGTKTLTLQVTGKNLHKDLAYHVTSKTTNVVANQFVPSDVKTLGLTAPGKYTFKILRGSKVLASGSMTEKK